MGRTANSPRSGRAILAQGAAEQALGRSAPFSFHQAHEVGDRTGGYGRLAGAVYVSIAHYVGWTEKERP
jgi:hypothetical protein